MQDLLGNIGKLVICVEILRWIPPKMDPACTGREEKNKSRVKQGSSSVE